MPVATIVCGVDGSDNASAALRFAHALSDWLEARLVVVHVAELPVILGVSMIPGGYDELGDMARGQGDELLDAVLEENGLPPDVDARVELGRRVEALAGVCEDEHADLLVVGAPGRGRIATAVFGSVATGVVGSVSCPVAVVPEEAMRAWSRRTAERRSTVAGRTPAGAAHAD
jgi:nucleotide-binding universal stress UspA family protein